MNQQNPVARKVFGVFAYALFWSWNVIFLAFMALGFAPTLLPEMVNAVRTRTIPASFLAYALVLIIIPLAGVILGLTVLRRSPGRLLAFGYGIEGPLMLLVAIRFFAVREATPIVILLLTVAALGLAVFLWQVLDRRIDERRPLLGHVRVLGLTLLLAIGLYAGLWIAFYAVPIPVIACGGAGKLEDVSDVAVEGRADALSLASILHYGFVKKLERQGFDFSSDGGFEVIRERRDFVRVEATNIPDIKSRLADEGLVCRPAFPGGNAESAA